jgi:hypothetical protein
MYVCCTSCTFSILGSEPTSIPPVTCMICNCRFLQADFRPEDCRSSRLSFECSISPFILLSHSSHGADGKPHPVTRETSLSASRPRVPRCGSLSRRNQTSTNFSEHYWDETRGSRCAQARRACGHPPLVPTSPTTPSTSHNSPSFSTLAAASERSMLTISSCLQPTRLHSLDNVGQLAAVVILGPSDSSVLTGWTPELGCLGNGMVRFQDEPLP